LEIYNVKHPSNNKKQIVGDSFTFTLIPYVNNLNKGYNYLTSNKFSIREKYLNFEQYDFSGNIEELEFCTKFLKQTNIIEIINFITCSNLILVNSNQCTIDSKHKLKLIIN
jgi:hypothetical protein